jgi:hypothetical protein
MALELRDYCADPSDVAAWLRIVAGESLERKASVVRRLMLTSAGEETVVRKLQPTRRRSRWGLAAVMSACGVAGAFSAWQLGGEPSAQAQVAERRTEPPAVVAALAPAAPARAAATVSEPLEPEPAPEVAPPAPIRKSTPRRVESRGVIDDGF